MHIKHNIDTKVVTILVGLVILSGCILSNIGTNNGIIGNGNNASATSDGSSSTTNVSVTVSDACTMSVSGNQGTVGEDGNYTYSATIQGGTNGEIIANSIKTFCNDFSGFSIYAIGYSNDTLGDTDLVYNNTTTTNDYNIKTDATGTYNSYWKMKLANNTTTNVATTIPATYQNYNVIPNDYTLVAQYNSNTGNTDTTSSIITPSYKVYIASAQPAGTYTGKVKYTLVHPMNAAKPEMPNPITEAFAAAGKEKYNGYYKMQDMTSAICNAIVAPTTITEDISTQLIDVRDNKLYRVAKLLDGNCWMVQNLALGNGGNDMVLTSNDSDIPSSVTLYQDSYAIYEDNPLYGNYYDFKTASAGFMVDGRDIFGGGKIATASICPKGWRLPKYDVSETEVTLQNSSDFYNLMSTVADADLSKNRGPQFNIPNQINLFSSPMSFVKSGNTYSYYYDEDTDSFRFFDDGYTVRLWNDFNSDEDMDAFFDIDDNIATIRWPTRKSLGIGAMLPIRCIAR